MGGHVLSEISPGVRSTLPKNDAFTVVDVKRLETVVAVGGVLLVRMSSENMLCK